MPTNTNPQGELPPGLSDLAAQYWITPPISFQDSATAILLQPGQIVTKKGVKTEREDLDMTVAQCPEGFKFGCDPEGFLWDGNNFISAEGVIPGTKHEPHKVECGAVQVDGFAAEFNIDPVSSYEEWERNLTTVMKQLEDMLPPGISIKYASSVTFDPTIFDEAPPQSKEIGCQPDFDAWTGDANPPPNSENPYVRCAGGHIHFGWTKGEDTTGIQHVMNCRDLVKQLDFFLAGWAATVDKDTIRRGLYGRMGACRYKDYGVEYRTLSNFWVSSKVYRMAVWNRMIAAINQMNHLFLPDRAPRKVMDHLRTAIETSEISSLLRDLVTYPIATINPQHNRF